MTEPKTPRTDIFFDFEFIDDGREIVPISVGMCAWEQEPPGFTGNPIPHEFYTEYQFDPARCNDWVRENVFPHLTNTHFPGAQGKVGVVGMRRSDAAREIREWVKQVCGETKPRFWGYFPSYDWVLLCQHYGLMTQGPKGWPIRPECLRQWADMLEVPRDAFPEEPKDAHNALADAKWNRDLHTFLSGVQAGRKILSREEDGNGG